MRLFLTSSFIVLVSVISVAQSTGRRTKSAVYSASSEWKKVTLKATARLATARPVNTPAAPVPQPVVQPTEQAEPAPVITSSSPDFRPAFTGDFATNRNGWKAGNHGDYNYQIGMGRYSIRKRNTNTQQVAFSAVELPTDINLNRADLFTIKVDVLADSGQVPTGGVLFGVKDSLNYSAFMLNVKGEVSIIRVANGKTFSDYMPGDYFLPGVSVEKNRNRLMIQRKGETLRFYINAQEIRTSPYAFKMLPGNGIGLAASGYWTSFQKLSVVLGN
ncbi:hypothetical protein EXU85_25220 [Spirosoma sp. KCTC 42546]|uniref:hypothetical protein n=1 Tax=Spirosoma sp. KCTC 42546 TaxID=2520506 RepID=UPI001158A15D|nr:hypothetical protein [Spirosoma sp. KCTC 42546]QDK81732.1 hypothetical protein EXU85_25220 [Spirosoma sp. KCTC 42546]